MKHRIIFITFFMSVFFANSLFSEEAVTMKTFEKGISFGIGTTINQGNIFVPIQFGNNFRLEPMIGLSVTNSSYSIDSLSYGTTDLKSYTLRYGIGGYYTFEPFKSGLIYTGIRFIFARNSSSNLMVTEPPDSTSSTEFTQNNLYFAGIFGGEYFLVKHFSLGIEALLNYSVLLKPALKNQRFDFIYNNYKYSSIYTSTLIFVRYYFN